MIRVSVLYPRTSGGRFDTSYYFATHVPLVRRKLGSALKGLAIDEGLAGGEPGTPPAYVMMFHMMFESVEVYQEAFAPHAETIVGDIPNYTDIQPTLQISEVKL